MIINPICAIEENWIREIKNPKKQVQPNAIDFTLDVVRKFIPTFQSARVGESSKKMRELELMQPTEGLWYLEPQTVYDGMSDTYVEVPEGVAAILFTRSTFARNGTFIMSGLYDSGFKGHIGFTVYNMAKEQLIIEVGTRIGQIMFVTADSAGTYSGQYNHTQGTDWK
jgi:deoxycytidine triphosphate deaminase